MKTTAATSKKRELENATTIIQVGEERQAKNKRTSGRLWQCANCKKIVLACTMMGCSKCEYWTCTNVACKVVLKSHEKSC